MDVDVQIEAEKLKYSSTISRNDCFTPAHGSPVLLTALKAATVEIKRVYKQVMDTLNKIYTKVSPRRSANYSDYKWDI